MGGCEGGGGGGCARYILFRLKPYVHSIRPGVRIRILALFRYVRNVY